MPKHARPSSSSTSLRVKPVPVPASAHHPNVPHHQILPQHEFTLGLIAPKGSGKTTLIANLLDFYTGYFHDIYVYSPTLHSDEKWDYIRKRPLRGENVALKKFMEKKGQGENPIVGRPCVVDTSNKKFDPHIPDECFMTEYDEATLQKWMTEQMQAIETIEQLGGSKHLADRVLIIFDDLVGSSLFSGARRSPFKMLNTNHRHHSCSILMVSQVGQRASVLVPFARFGRRPRRQGALPVRRGVPPHEPVRPLAGRVFAAAADVGPAASVGAAHRPRRLGDAVVGLEKVAGTRVLIHLPPLVRHVRHTRRSPRRCAPTSRA